MQIRQLEYFVSLCETLNFTRTAKQFFISQTAVTQQIHALEDELGVTLLRRNNRHVEITAPGSLLLEDAKVILQRVRDARHRVRVASASPTGSLRLGFYSGFETAGFSRHLEKFHRRCPGVSLSLSRLDHSNLYKYLLRGDLDLIINHRYPLPDQLEAQLHFREIRSYPLVAVFPSDHPLAGRSSILPGELREYPLVDQRREDTEYNGMLQLFRFFSDADIQPEVRFLSDGMESSLLAVSAGMGYALFPAFVAARFIPGVRLSAVPIEGYEEEIVMAFAWSRSNENPMVELFLETSGVPAVLPEDLSARDLSPIFRPAG